MIMEDLLYKYLLIHFRQMSAVPVHQYVQLRLTKYIHFTLRFCFSKQSSCKVCCAVIYETIKSWNTAHIS